MRPVLTVLLVAAGLMAASVDVHAQTSPDDLAKLKGNSRPIVVLSDSRDDPRVAKQISTLDHTRPGLTQRNIKVLREAQPGSTLRKSLGVEEKGFAVVLVGKDGSVKKVWKDPVDPKAIFSIIDAMPMRQQEMKG